MHRVTLLSAVFFSSVLSTQTFAQSNPMCLSPDSDTDGDGYGWENGQSCIAVASQQGQTTGVLNYCSIVYSPTTTCLDELGNDLLPDLNPSCEDDNGDGWGWNGQSLTSCRVNNLVRNGTFANGSLGWNTYLHPDSTIVSYSEGGSRAILIPGTMEDPRPSWIHRSNFEFNSDSGRVDFNFVRAGTQWWHSQLFTDPISLEGGRTYRLSFFADRGTSTEPAVRSVVVENGTDYTKYLDRQDFGVGAHSTQYRYAEFYVPASDNNARVTFNLGDNVANIHRGSFHISKVRLIALEASLDQQDGTSNCDYTNASIYSGWGWDSIAEESCPPQSVAPATCIDSDGDGWGWDGVGSCQVQ